MAKTVLQVFAENWMDDGLTRLKSKSGIVAPVLRFSKYEKAAGSFSTGYVANSDNIDPLSVIPNTFFTIRFEIAGEKILVNLLFGQSNKPVVIQTYDYAKIEQIIKESEFAKDLVQENRRTILPSNYLSGLGQPLNESKPPYKPDSIEKIAFSIKEGDKIYSAVAYIGELKTGPNKGKFGIVVDSSDFGRGFTARNKKAFESPEECKKALGARSGEKIDYDDFLKNFTSTDLFGYKL